MAQHPIHTMLRQRGYLPVALLALLLGAPTLSGPLPGGSGVAAAQEAPIDWARARELHEKVKRGETLTAEEQEYYQRAQAARRDQRGGQRTRPDSRSREGGRRQRSTTGGGTAELPTAAAWDNDFLPAFPGAEGAGARSVGGRGGRVVHVTNLDDRGRGSLRDAVQASGPRTIVFDVGGTIELKASLKIDNPHITIAGQTAPGGGIALKASGSVAHPLVYITTHDVVLRYVRIRPGPGAWGSMGLTGITVKTPAAKDIIIDHVSISWAVDKSLTISEGPRNVTMQWSILAETLYCSNHGKTVNAAKHGTSGSCPEGGTPHSRAVTIASTPHGVAPGDITLHHNLLAHNNKRHPNVVSAGPVAFINNVVYNLGSLGANMGSKPGSASGSTLDYVANYIKPGPKTERNVTAVSAPKKITRGVSVYTEGNVGADSIAGLTPPRFKDLGFLATQRWSRAPVTESSAEDAYQTVLADAGARLPATDAVDERIIADVRAGTGGFVDDPSRVGGWPDLERGSPPIDKDRDGMPAEWEARCSFLDDGDPADSLHDEDGDGYTEIEEYLHCLVTEGGLAPTAAGCSCNYADDSTPDPNSAS